MSKSMLKRLRTQIPQDKAVVLDPHEYARLRKIEAAAKEAFDNCVLYDDKCHVCTNTYSYEFSKEHAPDCKLKKLEEALGE